MGSPGNPFGVVAVTKKSRSSHYCDCNASSIAPEDFVNHNDLVLRTRPPPTGVKIPKPGKRGFWVSTNSHFSQCPRNGRFESKTHHFYSGLHKQNGDFLTQSIHFWGTGKNGGSFLTPKPSFPGFGDFDPCRGRTRSQILLPIVTAKLLER